MYIYVLLFILIIYFFKFDITKFDAIEFKIKNKDTDLKI